MDRNFLEYYEEELTHLRELSQEFAALHPGVAANLSLNTVPCPDPYVERLLEGVSFLTARTRMKVDSESARYAHGILDALYPDLVSFAPSVSIVRLEPGAQLDNMRSGHVVPRGTRVVSNLKSGLATRCTFTTVQDVHLMPLAITAAEFLPDRGTLRSAGVPDNAMAGAEAGLRLTFKHRRGENLADFEIDYLDIHFCPGALPAHLFDSVFGHGRCVLAGCDNNLHEVPGPVMTGISDEESLLPRTRATFEGYRLLREYFVMPERFHFMRLTGLRKAVKAATGSRLDMVITLGAECREIADVSANDFALHAVPIVNLFEKECNIVELDRRRVSHPLHADRLRPRDFEIYQILRVEDADQGGTAPEVPPLFAPTSKNMEQAAYHVTRRARRPGEDELKDAQMRSTYGGDDVFISLSTPGQSSEPTRLKRLDVRALCSNRDLPLLDDRPALSLDSGDPVEGVELLGALRPPRASLPHTLPKARGGTAELDRFNWRLISQLSLNFLSLAETGADGAPLRALLDIYADRGDPAMARHVRSIRQVHSKGIVGRIGLAGPMAFGRGTEITLDVDTGSLSGQSKLLLSALLDKLFARHASLNSFVKTKTHLMQSQEEIPWPSSPGTRRLI